MTLDEQKSITEFVQRVSRPDQGGLDVEADAIIRALFVRNPDAAYRITRLAMAQEHTLRAEQAHVCAAAEQVKPAANWLASIWRRDEKQVAAKEKLRG